MGYPMTCGVRDRRAYPRTRRKGSTARTAAATKAATQIAARRTECADCVLEIGVRSGGVWKVGVTGTLKLSSRWN